MHHRLVDWGYSVSTGPLVWNRHKAQLVSRPGGKRFPLIWAEAVTADGRFVWRAQKKNHAPYFEVREGDDWLLTNISCVLIQRTTAKEQSRRLIAAALPTSFILKHGAVAIENHLNMVRQINKHRRVSATVLAAFLNSAAADQAFRCVSGSVAVSAYELEALPLPAPSNLGTLIDLVASGASRDQIERECARLYGASG
jgi:adenine-specific DNA-methyltransferase